MKKTSIILFFTLFSSWSYANNSNVEIKITSEANLANSSAIEACGTATDSQGLKPILVTVKHEDSEYSTLSSPSGRWCIVIKRWNFNGTVDVSGIPLSEIH